MSGPEFFQTIMGKRFFEGQLPKLVSALERIATALEAQTPCPCCGEPLHKPNPCTDCRAAMKKVEENHD